MEREFDISGDKVKAAAVFVAHSFMPQELGLYHVDFTFTITECIRRKGEIKKSEAPPHRHKIASNTVPSTAHTVPSAIQIRRIAKSYLASSTSRRFHASASSSSGSAPPRFMQGKTLVKAGGYFEAIRDCRKKVAFKILAHYSATVLKLWRKSAHFRSR